MIVREQNDHYVMIEQDNHAHLSGKVAAAWKDSFFKGRTFKDSVEYAVSNHDIGWKPFDQQPFWNDAKDMPYTFIDFPVPAKTVLYKQGIEEVAVEDSYAALLCSIHYTRFLQKQDLFITKKFVEEEKDRRKHIMQSMEAFDQANCDFHYDILQFCDNVSLYACLNNPGTAKEKEHPFFKNGIPVPASFDFFKADKARIQWRDNQTVAMEIFPFTSSIDFTLKQKSISKEAVTHQGILRSYQEAPWEEQKIQLVPLE